MGNIEDKFKSYYSNDNGKSVDELIRLGYSAHQNGQKIEAIKYLENALGKINSSSPANIKNELFNIKLYLGVNYKRVGDYQKSYSIYKELLQMIQHQDDACEIHNALGKICYLLGRREESTNHYMSSIKYANDDNIKMNLLHHLGHAAIDLGDTRQLPPEWKAQIIEYKKSINGESHSYNPNLIETYINFGIETWNLNKR